MFQKDQKGERKSVAAGDSDNKRTERMPRKCFKCGSEDHLISKCPKSPKENEKIPEQVCLSERVNRELQKECNNGKIKKDQKTYAYMAHMSDNDEYSSTDFGDSAQLTSCILYSGEMCHIMPQLSDFIPDFLEDTDKHIEVAYRHHVM